MLLAPTGYILVHSWGASWHLPQRMYKYSTHIICNASILKDCLCSWVSILACLPTHSSSPLVFSSLSSYQGIPLQPQMSQIFVFGQSHVFLRNTSLCQNIGTGRGCKEKWEKKAKPSQDLETLKHTLERANQFKSKHAETKVPPPDLSPTSRSEPLITFLDMLGEILFAFFLSCTFALVGPVWDPSQNCSKHVRNGLGRSLEAENLEALQERLFLVWFWWPMLAKSMFTDYPHTFKISNFFGNVSATSRGRSFNASLWIPTINQIFSSGLKHSFSRTPLYSVYSLLPKGLLKVTCKITSSSYQRN